MPTLVQDIRYAVRTFRATPGFALVALLSLAIGIGANTAVFSVANALLLRPLPYADPDRLAILWNRSPGLDIAEDWFSTAQYFDIRDNNTTFEDLAIALGSTVNLTGDGAEAERIGVIRVSSNLLSLLGARPLLGRFFASEDDMPGRAATAVLGFGTWARRYGADSGVIGRTMYLNGQPAEIIGVLPSGFSLPREVLPTLGVAEDGEILLPLPLAANAAQFRGREDYNILARLRRGATVGQAQAEMDVLTARLRRDHPNVYPPNGGLTFSVVPLLDQVVGDVRRAVLILSGAVALVLLVACANVANLMLARALGRQREMTIRAAMGATRWRVARQLLTESLLLSAAGGMAGILFAFAGITWIQALRPPNVPRLGDIAITVEVLGFTLVVCVVAAVLFGLAPAIGAGRLDLQASLRNDTRVGGHGLLGRGSRMRRLLVAAELALSLVLLVGAGLLLRSFAQLQRVPPGFTPEGVVTFELSLVGTKYPNGPAAQDAFRQLWARFDALPGAVASGGITSLPLSGYFAWGPITIEGHVPPGGQDFINADQRVAGGRYFEVMRIPLVEGRFFNERDQPDAGRVVIVDERLAREYWPNESAIGKRLRTGPVSSGSTNWMTVVGVVGRVKQYGLDGDGRIAIYLPQTQAAARSVYVTIRTTRDPASVVPAVRNAVRAFDPDLPIYRVRTMEARVAESLARPRFAMTLLTLFAGLALILAAIGTYGVMAYLVSQSIRELGIRIALGATERGVLAMVLRQGVIVTVIGLFAGLGGAFILTRFLRSMLFGIPHTDPLTFTVVGAVLAAVSLAATVGPARRAARVDPTVAMRTE
ncbi:MAG TPA: ABC transporter permease [Gemmatimonadaceae bacterium]|nr:ABC transporter permease [Gemmatimonadaceae bacterium]